MGVEEAVEEEGEVEEEGAVESQPSALPPPEEADKISPIKKQLVRALEDLIVAEEAKAELAEHLVSQLGEAASWLGRCR